MLGHVIHIQLLRVFAQIADIRLHAARISRQVYAGARISGFGAQLQLQQFYGSAFLTNPAHIIHGSKAIA